MTLPDAARLEAFPPAPLAPAPTDILFDAWALTTLRDALPGRPPVADWLHGEADWDPPATRVAWREEVARLTDELVNPHPPADLLDDFPLESHELLRDQTTRVRGQLELMAKAVPYLPAWVLAPDGSARRSTIADLVGQVPRQNARDPLADCTVVLPPAAGGLVDGRLDGTVRHEEGRDPFDISCEGRDELGSARRQRCWEDEPPAAGMRLVRTIELRPNEEDAADDGEAGAASTCSTPAIAPATPLPGVPSCRRSCTTPSWLS